MFPYSDKYLFPRFGYARDISVPQMGSPCDAVGLSISFFIFLGGIALSCFSAPFSLFGLVGVRSSSFVIYNLVATRPDALSIIADNSFENQLNSTTINTPCFLCGGRNLCV